MMSYHGNPYVPEKIDATVIVHGTDSIIVKSKAVIITAWHGDVQSVVTIRRELFDFAAKELRYDENGWSKDEAKQ